MAFSFTVAALRDAAQSKTGHGDFSSDSYMPGLESLLYSLNHEANLNEHGEREIWARIVDSLANRLSLVAWEKAHPELAAADIGAPLVVLGLPRTGSSITHETLAAAPDACTPLLWQVRDFALAHQVRDARSDQRVGEIDAQIASKNAKMPGVLAMHYEDAYVPVECVFLTTIDLVSTVFPAIAWTPTYRNFLLSHDARETYAWHKRALRYLSVHNPGKRWVLKAPIHTLYIAALVETYPEAMLVHTHRALPEVLGSLASYNATMRRSFSDQVDTPAQAPVDATYTSLYVSQMMAYRQANPAVDARICDVAFRNFVRNPETAIAGIYAHIGLPFTPQAKEAMLGYLANRPREKYGAHDYSFEALGLDPAATLAPYAEYTAKFRQFL